MGCPLYRDFTRMCIEKFPDFLGFPTYDLCESNDYTTCLAHLIYFSPFVCPYLITCGNAYKNTIPKIITKMLDEKETRDLFYKFTLRYCVSKENHTKCAKYQCLSEGKTPPINLLPDGNKSRLIDILLKRRLVARSIE